MPLDRTRIFAFIADGDNDGIVAVSLDIPNAGPFMMPLVSLGDASKLEWMKRQAQGVAAISGKTVRLYEFTTPIEREVFVPAPESKQ